MSTVYVVIGEPHNEVNTWTDELPALMYLTALIGANLDAEIVPVPRVRWENGTREALRATLAALPVRGRLIEHPVTEERTNA